VEVIQRTPIFNFRWQNRWSIQNVLGLLKKTISRILRFFYQYRKLILLIAVVVSITLIFSFLLFAWFSDSGYVPNSDGDGDYVPNSEYDRNVSTTGTITVKGLEIYGGDVTVESENVYIDWGELSLGSSKNASFYVLSNSNVNVTLGLNVTDWAPIGIEDYIDIFWDYDGTVLSPGHEPLSVTVNLDVASSREFIEFLVENNVTAFGFDITIYASEV
jgi:hypothetical protein